MGYILKVEEVNFMHTQNISLMRVGILNITIFVMALKTDPLNVRQGPSECLFLYIVNDAKWT